MTTSSESVWVDALGEIVNMFRSSQISGVTLVMTRMIHHQLLKDLYTLKREWSHVRKSHRWPLQVIPQSNHIFFCDSVDCFTWCMAWYTILLKPKVFNRYLDGKAISTWLTCKGKILHRLQQRNFRHSLRETGHSRVCTNTASYDCQLKEHLLFLAQSWIKQQPIESELQLILEMTKSKLPTKYLINGDQIQNYCTVFINSDE